MTQANGAVIETGKGGTRGLRRLRAALLLAGAGLGAAASGTEAQTLRGSKASVEKMYQFAAGHGLAFRASPEAIHADAQAGRLVPLGGSLDYQLTTQIGWPYVTPETKRWVEAFAEQYAAVCDAPLTVTSASRPLNRQPRNANPHSVHPTGIAIDLRRPPGGPCLNWTRSALVELERRGVIEATEERHPVHLHIAVLTQPGRTESLPILRLAGQDPAAKRASWLIARQSYAIAGGSTAAAADVGEEDVVVASAPSAPRAAPAGPTRIASGPSAALRTGNPMRVRGVVVTEVAGDVQLADSTPARSGDSSTVAGAASAKGAEPKVVQLRGKQPAATREGATTGAGAVAVADTARSARGRVYRVRPGDTLWDIARRHRTKVEAIVAANHLGRRSMLRPGALLRLPDAPRSR